MDRPEQKMAALHALIDDCRTASERISAQLIPAFSSEAALRVLIEPPIDMKQQYVAALAPIYAEEERIRAVLDTARLPQMELTDLFARQFEDVQRAFKESLREAVEEVRENLRELPGRTQEALPKTRMAGCKN